MIKKMGSSKNERFLRAFEWTGLTSHGLAVKIGMNSRTVYNYTNKGMDPTLTCIRQMVKAFPQLSEEWLIEGIGEMFLDGTRNQSPKELPVSAGGDMVSKISELYERLIGSLEDKCARLEEQLEEANAIIAELRKESK